MRLAAYAGASTAAAAACLIKAFHQRPNFYSAAVYLSQSNACLLILTNLLLVAACSFLYGLQRGLYGPLRPIEIEQLSEKAWYAVLDTLLAMPSFREDVGGWLLTMFILLLAGKVWGWIGEGRVDILEQQPPANPRLFHARLSASLILGVVFSMTMLNYCVDTVTAEPRPGMMVIFTFEFALLLIFSLFTLLRYALAVQEAIIVDRQTKAAVEERKEEIRGERVAAYVQQTPTDPTPPPANDPIEVDENEVDVPGWEDKRRWLFWLEMTTDAIKLVLYVVFFTISVTFNGLPMHIMRDVYMTFASFSDRIRKYIEYTKATSNMDKYPDATTDEIRGDSCIVCREDMVAWEQPAANAAVQAGAAPATIPPRRRDEGLRAKKLPCGHILHLRCLKAWLERQSVCPTCRRPVNPDPAAGAGQPGVPGAPGAAARPGQQPAQRPNGARIFNLGRIRVGFLRGPGDQIQNIVDQMNNQPRNPPAGGQANTQPGPNHLGLQQPYGDNHAPGHGNGARAEVPRQIQLMQMEQRILQDVQRLGLEQQQLTTLRALESELARLRTQALSGTQRPLPLFPTPSLPPVQQSLANSMHQGGPAFPQGFYGHPQQQLANGQAGVPAGMTLPEGWTIMPLQPMQPQHSVAAGMSVHPAETRHTAGTSAQVPAQQASAQRQSDVGPTNGDGEPLFEPNASPALPVSSVPSSTQAATSQEADILAQEAPASNDDSEVTTQVADTIATDANELERAAATVDAGSTPWASGDWSFAEPAASDSVVESAPTEPQSEPVAAASTESASADAEEQRDRAYEGKGKGKAVEVEDVPDVEL